jgi:hypothetical protein
MRVLISCTFLKVFIILRRIKQDIINVLALHVKHLSFLSEFNKIRIFLTDFRKILKYKFHENPSSGNRVVPYGRTDRRYEANSHFSHFASAPKKGFYGAVSNNVPSVMKTCQLVKILNWGWGGARTYMHGAQRCHTVFNPLVPEFFFYISTPVCKIWIIQEPKKVALWNKRHFEEKRMENVQHV